MKDEEVNKYSFVAFDEPEVRRYGKPDGGELTRLRIPVSATSGPRDTLILGYLPLPLRYLKHWKQLCYNIVYFKCLHASLKVLEREGGYKYARDTSRTASAILKYNLYCRGKIIEEIFSLQGAQFDNLPTFNEYIIKERWDLHWTEPAELEVGTSPGIDYLGCSPFEKDVVDALGNVFLTHISHISPH
jgi:hypothetical protein